MMMMMMMMMIIIIIIIMRMKISNFTGIAAYLRTKQYLLIA